MKTWAQVQAFIDKHSLPYRITHWNLSMRGCLIDEYNGWKWGGDSSGWN